MTHSPLTSDIQPAAVNLIARAARWLRAQYGMGPGVAVGAILLARDAMNEMHEANEPVTVFKRRTWGLPALWVMTPAPEVTSDDDMAAAA